MIKSQPGLALFLELKKYIKKTHTEQKICYTPLGLTFPYG